MSKDLSNDRRASHNRTEKHQIGKSCGTLLKCLRNEYLQFHEPEYENCFGTNLGKFCNKRWKLLKFVSQRCSPSCEIIFYDVRNISGISLEGLSILYLI